MPPEEIKVLFVDDDEDDYFLARTAFEEIEYLPHRAEWAASYEEGERRIMEDRHDVYFIDHRLGERTGLELLKAVIARGCQKPLIFLTGQGDHEIDLEAMRSGAVDYLVKANISAGTLERAARYAISNFRAMNELRKAKAAVEEATKLKDKFVSLVAHDIRSPLAGIMLLLQATSLNFKDPQFDELRAGLALAVGACERMVNMSDDLLSSAQLRDGSMRLDRKLCNIGNICAAAMEDLHHVAAQKGIVLKNEVPHGARLYADKALLSRVVHNLLGNALKFSHEGGIVTVFMPEGNSRRLAVKDAGTGISSKILPHLFSRDVQTSIVGTAGEKGHGYGLPTCRDIMEAHGGTIQAITEQGKGSTFFIELPDVKPLALVADGDKEALFILSTDLEEMGAEVLTAKNGAEALEMMQGREPALIITDLKMPVMDGFDLL